MNTSTIDRLYLLPPHPTPPESFQKAYKSLGHKFQGNGVPWEFALPNKAYKSFQRDMESYQQLREGLDLSYYNNIYLPTEEVFEYLKPAKINLERYEQFLSADQTGHLRSFQPNEDGYARLVEYDRVSTVTGRLKTTAGPTLLHLSKVYRSVLQSRWKDKGTVIALDYKCLEPRVLLSCCGTQPKVGAGEKDIYEYVQRNLFSSNKGITREIVKKVILAELYGAGIETLREKLPDVCDLEGVMLEISRFFGLEELRARLQEEWKATNNRWITSFYGRRVKTETAHTLVNHYVQCTAVDISLFGFLNILRYLRDLGTEWVVPLFILHDALVLDIQKDNGLSLVNGLCKIGASDIKGLESTMFYMSADKNFSGGENT